MDTAKKSSNWSFKFQVKNNFQKIRKILLLDFYDISELLEIFENFSN